MATVRFKRGAVSGLPTGSAGEPLFTTDQYRLYVGDGTNNRLLGLLNKNDATTAPGVNDDAGDGFSPGSQWTDVANDVQYVCLDSTIGAAVWSQSSGGGGGGVAGSDKQVQFNDGGAFGAEAGFEYDKSTNQLTVPGHTITEDLVCSAQIFPTPAANNWNPTGLATAFHIFVSLSGDTTITGMVSQGAGAIRVITPTGTGSLTLAYNSGSSSAGNRFILPGGASLTIPLGGSVILRDDGSIGWWVLGVADGTTQRLARGGTGADLSATGPGFVRQASTGAALSVSAFAESDLPGGGWIGTSQAEYVLAANYTAGSDDTWLDINDGTSNLQVTCADGLWRLFCDVAFNVSISAGAGQFIVRLFDVTAGAVVANTERRLARLDSSVMSLSTTVSCSWTYNNTSGSNRTVKVQVMRLTISAPTWSVTNINGGTTVRTVLSGFRVSS